MGLFKKKDYFDIGKNGTADKFLKVVDALRYDSDKLNSFLDGAIEALREGHPENIQTAILHAKDLAYWSYCSYPVPLILFRISEKSDDKVADIKRALGKIPEHDKKEVLNRALYDSVAQMDRWFNSISMDDSEMPFFSLLLQAGADVNAKIDGYPGSILGRAVCSSRPAVVKFFHENGADFDAALARMSAAYEDWITPAEIERLKFYQEAMTDKPDVVEIKKETFQQLLEQVQDLTERVDRLSPPAPAPSQNTEEAESAEEKDREQKKDRVQIAKFRS